MFRYLVQSLGIVVLALLVCVDNAWAAEAGQGGGGLVAIAAGLAMGLAAVGGALGQSRAVCTALESIGRNPSAAQKMFTPMLLGLVFIETLVIFTFVIAFFLLRSI